MKQPIGTCSLCGGIVAVESPWHGVNLPQAVCRQCGAKEAYGGPVIPMTPRRTGDAYDTRTRPVDPKPPEPQA